MFCNRCGSEIVEDSVYCSYCGEKVTSEEPASATNSGTPTSSRNRPVIDDGCVRPHAPRKTCPDCGKSLPASTDEDCCTLCFVKRMRAEEERTRTQELRDRKKADERRRAEPDYRRENPQKARQVTSYFQEEKAKPKSSGPNGCLIAVLIPVVLFVLMVVGVLAFGIVGRTTQSTMERIEPDSNPPVEVAVESAAASVPEFAPESIVHTFTVDELYALELLPIAEQIVGMLPYDPGTVPEISFHRETLSADEGYIYLSGSVTRTFQEQPITQEITVGFLISEMQAIQLLIALDGDIILDNRAIIAPDGSFDPELEAELGWDSESRGPFFTAPVYRLAELEGSDTLAPLPDVVTGF